MSQPTLSTGYSSAGITTMRWGTDGILQSPSPGGTFAGTGYYIVESIEESEKVEQEYGTNGTGIEAWRVILKHGKRWNITVQDDTSMSPPSVGTTAWGVVDPLNNPTLVWTATVITNDYRAARRQPGHRVVQVENLTLVDSQVTTIAP